MAGDEAQTMLDLGDIAQELAAEAQRHHEAMRGGGAKWARWEAAGKGRAGDAESPRLERGEADEEEEKCASRRLLAAGPGVARDGLSVSKANAPHGRLDDDSLANQSFFLSAVFDLVQSKLEWETQVLEGLRLRFPGLPASNEAIMYGLLRRYKTLHNPSKFVVVSPGLLTYVSANNMHLPTGVEGGAVPSPLLLFNKQSHNKKESGVIKQVRLPPGTRCEPTKKKSGKYLFEVITPSGSDPSSPSSSRPIAAHSGDGRLWMCASSEERMRWMKVIEDAASLTGQLVQPGMGSQPTDVEALNAMHARMLACQTESEYLHALGSMFGISGLGESFIPPASNGDQSDDNRSVVEDGDGDDDDDGAASARLCYGYKRIEVPLEWVHDRLNLPRGGTSENTTTEQIFKDMQRDTVSINGRLFTGWRGGGEGGEGAGGAGRANSSSGSYAGPGICSIVYALAQEIQRNSDGVYLTEAEALALSHQVLLACNRTQSGGNTLDAVRLLCSHDDFAIVAADSAEAPPLKVTVYRLDTGVEQETDTEDVESGSEGDVSTWAAASMHDNNQDAEDSASVEASSDPRGAAGSRRGIHRKTSSDGEFIYKTQVLESQLFGTGEVGAASASASAGAGAGADAQGESPNHSSRTQSPFNPKQLQTDIRRSIAKIRHRRRASEPSKDLAELARLSQALAAEGRASMPSSPTARATSTRSLAAQAHEGPTAVRDPGPLVDVQVVMHFRVCNPNFQDESDAVWARVTATFHRTFALVGQRKSIALGQGVVSLTLCAAQPAAGL